MTIAQEIVTLTDGRRVCLSFGVVVAVYLPGRGYVRTAHKFSYTSTRHANCFAGKVSPKVSHDEVKRLAEPVRSRL